MPRLSRRTSATDWVPALTRVAARWPSLRAPLDRWRGCEHPRWPARVFPFQSASGPKTFRSLLVPFASTAKTHTGSCGLSSWPASCTRTFRKMHAHTQLALRSGSSHGVAKELPSIDTKSSRPVPSSLRKASPSARPLPSRSHTFRPCRSSRLRRFAPTRSLQVCFTSQPTMGFTTFQTRTNGLLLSTICTGRNLR